LNLGQNFGLFSQGSIKRGNEILEDQLALPNLEGAFEQLDDDWRGYQKFTLTDFSVHSIRWKTWKKWKETWNLERWITNEM